MKVVIFGATGFAGNAVLKETLAQNHQVTLLVRNGASVSVSDKRLTIIEGDVMDRKKVSEVLEGQDAVIECLGSPKGNQPTTFVSGAMRIIVSEMERLQVSRLVAMSNIGAGNSIGYNPWYFTKFILPYFMKWLKVVIDDKNRMEPIVMNSQLNWTIVRCPNIVARPAKGRYHATLDGKGLKLSITLSDMARFLVNQLTDATFSKQAPSISN
ncbi:MAG TPA: NAD(P)H-binding protein [Puia sp.]|uniref:NAD(P)-dependent oxidoreductase n=1 Tax=Puia sp. TaxID=2045100 RepID=UPI002B9DB7AA|nr:NAD(P)H-binding protein [Puia sp.]HVU94084.1 NAD(P)H-binding protein [Puia sp.]